jgi:hypothetical protein
MMPCEFTVSIPVLMDEALGHWEFGVSAASAAGTSQSLF